MQYDDLFDYLQHVGRDPSRLVFEDELTGLHNRRFLLSFFEHKVRWDRDEHFPVSLLAMDVDHFKSINDTYGHEAGDEALTFVAALLKEAGGGSDAMPVRFGGDEFMVLLPRTELPQAAALAHKIQRLAEDRPLLLAGGKGKIRISLSIGVASAPTDAASGTDLMRKADVALYASKEQGRNRVSVAKETDPSSAAPRIALHRLDEAGIAGRGGELRAMSQALEALSLGQACFLLLEGASGMGKSTVLEAIQRNLASNDTVAVVKLVGEQRQAVQPYYLAGQAIGALMPRRPDRGISALDALSPRERQHLGHVLPGLDPGGPALDEDERHRREGIFVTLLKLTRSLLEGRPLVILVDDLHFADEGTLAFLRVLLARPEVHLLVCGTVNDTLGLDQHEQASPWRRFLQTRGSELRLVRRQLQPLTKDDIRTHLSTVFPGIILPPGFEAELARITAGNPLFLAEILRKLVLDRKLALAGRGWAVEPLEPGYLPRSLEEIVGEKLGALDEESRKLLEQVSTHGEHVPLSVVAGATHLSENDVLAFLDRAESLGLLRTDFQVNDENMRFLGKRVLDIVYGSMGQQRRQELHERIGTYQEELNRSRIGPSASILAYHFKRSANQEKAARYDQVVRDVQRRTFNRHEAERYTGEATITDEDTPREERLPAEALAELPALFRTFVTTVRSAQLYPPESHAIRRAHQTAFDALAAVLAHADHVELSRSDGVLLANGHKVDVTDFRLVASSFLDLMERAELESLDFRQGITLAEIRVLLGHLGNLKPETIAGTYWRSFSAEQGLEHVALRQLRYSEVRKKQVGGRAAAGVAAELGPEEWTLLPRVLRAVLAAAKSVKLYPLGSRQVGTAVDQVMEALSPVLARRPVLTLVRAKGSLLVNGSRPANVGVESLSEGVMALFLSAELESVTFLESMTRDELLTFFGALKNLPGDLTAAFWPALARERQLQGLAFNDRRYSASGLATVLETVAADPDAPEPEPSALAGSADGPSEALIEALPATGRELLARKEEPLARKLLRRLFADYATQDPAVRGRIVRACRTLMDSLVQALQHQFGILAADHLLKALREEDDEDILGELTGLLQQLAGSAVQFADLPLAGRMFGGVRDRQAELTRAARAGGRGLTILTRTVDSSTRALLLTELHSGEPERQQQAALVLESLGKPAIPVLIDAIKQEPDIRTRQLAARLLSRMGAEAADRIKRDVVLEVASERRLRILDVVDAITHDLRAELSYCLADVNPKIRQAALRLSERLNDTQVIELLVEFARHQDVDVAKGAIRSLATLRWPGAGKVLIATLEEGADPERAIACVQVLAQLGDAAAVPVLESILTARSFPLVGRLRWNDQVRATAAFALAHIGGDQASSILKRVVNDPDPRIRQIALHGSGEIRPSVPEGAPDDQESGEEDVRIA
jgi:diguanylate cyclase (GGDEF)-like protein